MHGSKVNSEARLCIFVGGLADLDYLCRQKLPISVNCAFSSRGARAHQHPGRTTVWPEQRGWYNMYSMGDAWLTTISSIHQRSRRLFIEMPQGPKDAQCGVQWHMNAWWICQNWRMCSRAAYHRSMGVELGGEKTENEGTVGGRVFSLDWAIFIWIPWRQLPTSGVFDRL